MKKHLLVLLPWFCMCIGAALNVLVITANHGAMPVSIRLGSDFAGAQPGVMLDTVHIAWFASVRLGILADWIQIPWLGTASIGDLFLWFGEWISPYAIGAWLALVWSERKKQYLTQAYDGVLYDRAARTAQPEPRLRLQ